MKLEKRIRKEEGITLVALIITIIVLVILASVTISIVTKLDIINVALKGADKYEEEQYKEKEELEKINDKLEKIKVSDEGLPENTEDIEAGTLVKLPNEWITKMPAMVSTANGAEVEASKEVATVYAVATGNGETVPVPYGFYYVGGKINSGVVISDDVRDQNKYAGQEDVPSGVAYNEDGTVNTENSELKGNQFVWIPCQANEYVKKDWGKATATWETQTNTAELPQIQKYGGFYIGRYEAGTSEITLSTGINFAGQNTASGWLNDNFSIRDGLNHTWVGKITTKAGEIPYYHADYFTALKLSNSMYQTDYVQSGLATGTMWDAMMKFIAGSDDTVVKSSPWGNYTNGNVTYTEGKGRYGEVDSTNGTMTSAFTKSDGTYHDGIKTTAISEDVKKKNLYDVAGNLWEWTQEAAYPTDTIESYMLRGGGFDGIFTDEPACIRGGDPVTATTTLSGFRPALYLK